MDNTEWVWSEDLKAFVRPRCTAIIFPQEGMTLEDVIRYMKEHQEWCDEAEKKRVDSERSDS